MTSVNADSAGVRGICQFRETKEAEVNDSTRP
jgi:hypothetical protein